MKYTKLFASSLLLSSVLLMAPAALAHDDDNAEAIASCLHAWGNAPFGPNPTYKTLATSVKVFGIGQDTVDSQHTASPALVLVNPGVNVMGGTTVELLNPNGWYCFDSNVNVMGRMTIKAACSAHLASAQDGATVLGSDQSNKSVTVFGKTQVQLVGCK